MRCDQASLVVPVDAKRKEEERGFYAKRVKRYYSIVVV